MKVIGTKKRWAEFLYDYPNRRIKERVDALGLKSNNLSDLMNTILPDDKKITADAVRQWVGGYTRPDIARLPAIADALNCSIDYLMGREDHPTRIETDIVSGTGLTVMAVNRLCSFASDANNLNRSAAQYLKTLSALLESECSTDLLRSIYLYFYTGNNIEKASLQSINMKYKSEKTNKFEANDVLNTYFEEFNIHDFAQIFQDSQMARIQELLSEMRKKISKE